MSTVDTVRELAESFAPDLNLEVFDVEFANGLLRITADRADRTGTADPTAGTTISMLQKLSKKVAREIEEQDLIANAFTLEVSSPGLERKLRTPDHFQRSIGEKINVKTFPGFDGDRRNVGLLTAADDQGITLAITESTESTGSTDLTIRYDQIAKATTVFDWGPQEKPGKSKKSPKSSQSPKLQNETGAQKSAPTTTSPEKTEKRAAS